MAARGSRWQQTEKPILTPMTVTPDGYLSHYHWYAFLSR